MYHLNYTQQCPQEWDDSTLPAETVDRQNDESCNSNLHAEEDFKQKIESMNLDPPVKILLLTYEEVFGDLPPPLPAENGSGWT